MPCVAKPAFFSKGLIVKSVYLEYTWSEVVLIWFDKLRHAEFELMSKALCPSRKEEKFADGSVLLWGLAKYGANIVKWTLPRGKLS